MAKSGSVNYTWGADALATMHDFVVTNMLYVLYICYAIASLCVIVSALQIYIKWNTGDQDIIKSIITLVGACLFIIGASIVFPCLFRLSHIGDGTLPVTGTTVWNNLNFHSKYKYN